MQRFVRLRIATQQRCVMSSWRTVGHHLYIQKQAHGVLCATSAHLVSCAILPMWQQLLRASMLYQTMLLVRTETAPLLTDCFDCNMHCLVCRGPEGQRH